VRPVNLGTEQVFAEVRRVAEEHAISEDDAVLRVLAVGASKLYSARMSAARSRARSAGRPRMVPTPSEARAVNAVADLVRGSVR
jgi:hypothetical protein